MIHEFLPFLFTSCNHSILNTTYLDTDSRYNVVSQWADLGLHSCFHLLMAVGLYSCVVEFEYHPHKLQDSHSSLPTLSNRHQLFLCEREKRKQTQQQWPRLSSCELNSDSVYAHVFFLFRYFSYYGVLLVAKCLKFMPFNFDGLDMISPSSSDFNYFVINPMWLSCVSICRESHYKTSELTHGWVLGWGGST